MPVRVLFDHYVMANQEFGGISRYLACTAAALPFEGVEPTFFSPLFVNHQLATLPRKYVWGVKVDIPPRARRLIGALAVATFPLAARFARPDVVHETYYSERRLAPRGVPIVLTVHDMIHEIFSGQFGERQTAAAKRAAIERADHIICVSENTRRDLLSFYPEAAERASVIHLGFDAEQVKISPYSVIRPYLLYVGNRAGYKNFNGLFDAYAASPRLNKNFDIICAGGGRFSRAELEMIGAQGFGNKIRHVSANDRELGALYAGAATFVYPSLYEGFGIPPLEAMAADCPTVAFRLSSIPEVCGDAVEYADCVSPEALGAAVERVVDSPSRADALRAMGKERLKRYSWQKCAAETAAIYRAII